MQVIGLCRFSYPALGGFQIEHQTAEDRAAYLYASARMQERFAYFEAMTVPSLAAQTDPDFTLLVLIGEDLPPVWHDRLRTALRHVPQAKIVTRPPGRHRTVCQEVINSERGPGLPASLQFRMDDDDAVACDFIANLRSAHAQTERIANDTGLMAYDFPIGHLAALTETGLHTAPHTRPLETAALGIFVAQGKKLTIMNFGHHRLAQFMPVLSLPTADMYLRGWNGTNDSGFSKRGTPDFAPLTPQVAARFGLAP